MTKTEFTEQLRRSISEVNDYQFVNDTVKYYDDYIDTRIRKGESEESVLESLGDPRLIAKSILATKEAEAEGGRRDSYVDRGASDSMEDPGRRTFVIGGRKIDLPLWAAKLIGGAGAVLMVIVLFIIGRALLPIVVIVALFGLFYKFIKDNFLN